MRKNDGQTLEEFLASMAEKVQRDSQATLKVGTMLTDLVDELGAMIKDLFTKALVKSEAAKELASEMRAAVDAQDHDRWDEASKKAYVLQGEISAYMEIANQLQTLGANVVGREDETKH